MIKLAAAIVVSIFSFGSSSHAAEAYPAFASCQATIDGIPFSFEFFEEVDSETGIASGKGYALQTMGEGATAVKMLGRIDIAQGEGEEKIVKLYAFATPGTLFAELTISTLQESKVKVFARNFGTLWAELDCKPAFPL